MAVPEIKNRQPDMMTLISLAISVAFVYSLAALFLPTNVTFFWELVTLIDIMLLEHWIEMRRISQTSSALNELARLMPDTAERILPDGNTETRRWQNKKWKCDRTNGLSSSAINWAHRTPNSLACNIASFWRNRV